MPTNVLFTDGYRKDIFNENIEDTGCEFVSNFILQKTLDPEVVNGVTTGNTYCGVVYCKDSDGIISDETGMVTSATLIRLLENCPILPEILSD